MFSCLLGGNPKPEPEQVIRNYTEELKTAPDEVGTMGAMLLLVLFGNKRQLQTRRMPAWFLLEGPCPGASGCRLHALGTWV